MWWLGSNPGFSAMLGKCSINWATLPSSKVKILFGKFVQRGSRGEQSCLLISPLSPTSLLTCSHSSSHLVIHCSKCISISRSQYNGCSSVCQLFFECRTRDWVQGQGLLSYFIDKRLVWFLPCVSSWAPVPRGVWDLEESWNSGTEASTSLNMAVISAAYSKVHMC